MRKAFMIIGVVTFYLGVLVLVSFIKTTKFNGFDTALMFWLGYLTHIIYLQFKKKGD